jgi:hypothetical protein
VLSHSVETTSFLSIRAVIVSVLSGGEPDSGERRAEGEESESLDEFDTESSVPNPRSVAASDTPVGVSHASSLSNLDLYESKFASSDSACEQDEEMCESCSDESAPCDDEASFKSAEFVSALFFLFAAAFLRLPRVKVGCTASAGRLLEIGLEALDPPPDETPKSKWRSRGFAFINWGQNKDEK